MLCCSPPPHYLMSICLCMFVVEFTRPVLSPPMSVTTKEGIWITDSEITSTANVDVEKFDEIEFGDGQDMRKSRSSTTQQLDTGHGDLTSNTNKPNNNETLTTPKVPPQLLPLSSKDEPKQSAKRAISGFMMDEWCKKFSQPVLDTFGGGGGSTDLSNTKRLFNSTQVFHSPLYPQEYPANVECFRTLTAPYGYFTRLDFRNTFRLEPPNEKGSCEYDFLEIRDGNEGYAPLIGKYCGSNFPPMITSSGRSLWMRFNSDHTIQYTGFKAVFEYIPNPLEIIPDIGPCRFETFGYQDFISSDNITKERKDHSLRYDTPIDCIWLIDVIERYTISFQFRHYTLHHPNDCNLNYVQVFDEQPDQEHQMKKFCGSAAESILTATNRAYIRFYAEKTGIESSFDIVFTAMRSLQGPADICDSEFEYDCDDATCIHPSLVCNSIRNCKLGWDEEACVISEDPDESPTQDPNASLSDDALMLDLSAAHVIAILLILFLITSTMCIAMIYNLIRIVKDASSQQWNNSEDQGSSVSVIGEGQHPTNDKSNADSSRNNNAISNKGNASTTEATSGPHGNKHCSNTERSRQNDSYLSPNYMARNHHPTDHPGMSIGIGNEISRAPDPYRGGRGSGCYVPDVGFPLDSRI